MADNDGSGVILRVMTVMMLADGRVENKEVEVVSQLYQQITGEKLTAERIEKEVQDLTSGTEGAMVLHFLAQMEPHLGDDAKKLVIQAAFKVATADGRIEEVEKNVIAGFGAALKMTTAEVVAIMTEMMAQVTEAAKEMGPASEN